MSRARALSGHRRPKSIGRSLRTKILSEMVRRPASPWLSPAHSPAVSPERPSRLHTSPTGNSSKSNRDTPLEDTHNDGQDIMLPSPVSPTVAPPPTFEKDMEKVDVKPVQPEMATPMDIDIAPVAPELVVIAPLVPEKGRVQGPQLTVAPVVPEEGKIRKIKIKKPRKSTVEEEREEPLEGQLPKPKKILFDVRRLTNAWTRDWPKPSGLANNGVQCYANTAIQIIAHTPMLAEFLSNLDTLPPHRCPESNSQSSVPGKGAKACLLCRTSVDVRSILDGAQPGKRRTARSWISSHPTQVGPGFPIHEQCDSHEFRTTLLDKLHESFLPIQQRGKPRVLDDATEATTLIQQVFGGWTRNSISCRKCGRTSSTFQRTTELQLPMTRQGGGGGRRGAGQRRSTGASSHQEASVPTLGALIAKTLAPESIEYRCDACQISGAPAVKKTTFEKLPRNLTLQVGRFDWSGRGRIPGKLAFPDSLDMSSHTTDPTSRHPTYRLHGVTFHLGKWAGSGHYTAAVKTASGKWLMIDDDDVSEVPLKRVLQMQDEVYMLHYTAVEDGRQPQNEQGQQQLIKKKNTKNKKNKGTDSIPPSPPISPTKPSGLKRPRSEEQPIPFSFSEPIAAPERKKKKLKKKVKSASAASVPGTPSMAVTPPVSRSSSPPSPFRQDQERRPPSPLALSAPSAPVAVSTNPSVSLTLPHSHSHPVRAAPAPAPSGSLAPSRVLVGQQKPRPKPYERNAGKRDKQQAGGEKPKEMGVGHGHGHGRKG
ncbi:hypothetical protein HKX48_002218 [Thoreauomyces humboldtii]|nr:hypothetical protein HKX48_002218 [Thoreauomyces humboldtii]